MKRLLFTALLSGWLLFGPPAHGYMLDNRPLRPTIFGTPRCQISVEYVTAASVTGWWSGRAFGSICRVPANTLY